ncbi:hypothetical protein Cgig2_009145 [Carnegiea gigantea]|uniref:Uncharacterized protein n=1 Tax=Carnegiea gigantea TaxID=171969 RepID=A0A9Q1JPH7_9CARY|nr:hypothetical protein Cgig2_009145 [Carnegiea gigantea]
MRSSRAILSLLSYGEGKRGRPRFVPNTADLLESTPPNSTLMMQTSDASAKSPGTLLNDLSRSCANSEAPTQSPTTPVAQVPPTSSYASLVDPDDGTSLNFVPATLINGKKCAKLEKADIFPDIDYWKNAVLCSVMGANPPFAVMESYMNRIRRGIEILKVLLRALRLTSRKLNGDHYADLHEQQAKHHVLEQIQMQLFKDPFNKDLQAQEEKRRE